MSSISNDVVAQRVSCDKCKRVMPTSQTRTYHLTLRTTNVNSPIDRIVLCKDCNANRHTTLTRYVSPPN